MNLLGYKILKIYYTSNITAFVLFSIIFKIELCAADRNTVFRNLTIENGLSQSTVLNIIQDKKGFMWFGTANGLNKYDGYSFKVYTNIISDTTSISDNLISALYEDSEGYIWIGTGKGILNKFDRKSEIFFHYKSDFDINKIEKLEDNFYKYPIIYSRNDNKTITTITEDNKGNLWIGTWGCGVIKLNKKSGKFSLFVHQVGDSTSISFNRIKQILIDHSGKIWVATFGGGLNLVFEEGKKTKFLHFLKNDNDNFSLSSNLINSIYEDTNKNLWIATYNGLNKLNADKNYFKKSRTHFTHYLYSRNVNSLNNNIVMAVTSDNKGNLWIGTFGGGLDKLNLAENNFVNYKNDPFNPNSLVDNKIISLYTDKSNIIWIGTYLGKGISIARESTEKFSTLKYNATESKGLNDNIVWSIYEDKAAILWIGTNNGGLNRYDRKTGKISYFTNSPNNIHNLSGNQVRAIVEDKWRNLWIGTYNNGLNVYINSTKTFKYYKHNSLDQNSISSNQIQSLYFDSYSTLWIGTFGGGLCRTKINENSWKENLKFTVYKNLPNDSTSISDNRVYTIHEDSKSIMWVGTFGGINKLNKQTGQFIRYYNIIDDKSSLTDNRVLIITEDKNGFLWIGTYGGGLNKFDKTTGKFTGYTKFNDVRIDIVYGIVEDEKGFLWISTDNGLLKLNPETEAFNHYNIHDGLQSMEFSGGAYFRNKKGEVFFGGINGVNYFFPDSVKNNLYVPPIAITGFKVFNKPIKGEVDNYNLTYDKNFFTLEFAALDYMDPADNHFAYKLEGFDREWHYVGGSERYASYMNLKPGEYTFKVKGSNSDGIWNDKGAFVKLLVLPPFWKTWWFILISILALCGLISSIIIIKVKSLLSLERLKTKLASNLHDDVGAGLTEVSILSELVVSEVGSISDSSIMKLNKISEISRLLIDKMSDIVWFVNPKRDSLHDLILRLKDSYSDFLSYTGISFKTNNIDVLENIKLPMEYRQNLYLIFKEGINNSIKHSQCKKIMLNANLNGRLLEITLKDDGQGINKNVNSLGNGMNTMLTRAKTIGGNITFNSIPDGGTSICFVGRIRNSKRRF